MDLRLVEYFVAVIDHGGITRAATALYIAQPSLSAAIRGLESELGVQLFDRSTRQLELTPAGVAFQGPARRVLHEAAQARSKVGAVRDLRAGRLHVAATATLTVAPLPALVNELRNEHPGIQVHVADPGNPAGVVTAVRLGQAELGLTQLPVGTESLTTEHLWTQRIVLAMAPELAAGLPDPVPRDLVRTLPLVLEVGDRLTAVIADPELRDAVGTVAIRCAHRQAIWELVMKGAGATFLPEQLARRVLRRVELRATDPEVLRRVGVVYRPGHLSPAAAAFLEVARIDAAGPDSSS